MCHSPARLNYRRIICKITNPKERQGNAIHYGSAGIEDFAQSDSLAATASAPAAADRVEAGQDEPSTLTLPMDDKLALLKHFHGCSSI
jgi:hypothetical protein